MAEEPRETFKMKIKRFVEMPLLTKCCFCVPLRRGLIAIAYINLAVSFLLLELLVYNIHIFDSEDDSKNSFIFKGYFLADLIEESVLKSVEFIIIIVLIVGLHMQKVVLMKWYFYFGIAFLLLDVVFALISMTLYVPSELMIFIARIMTQTYILVLVWSLVLKIARNRTVKYSCSEDQT